MRRCRAKVGGIAAVGAGVGPWPDRLSHPLLGLSSPVAPEPKAQEKPTVVASGTSATRRANMLNIAWMGCWLRSSLEDRQVGCHGGRQLCMLFKKQ